MNTRKIIMGVVILLFGLGALLYFGIYRETREQRAQRLAAEEAAREKRQCEDGALAYVKSHTFVKPRLRSPGSAEFPEVSEVTTEYVGDCRHSIRAYVDSLSATGGTLRTRYVATMRYAGQDTWAVDELRILE